MFRESWVTIADTVTAAILTDKQGYHTRCGDRNDFCVDYIHRGLMEGADISMAHGKDTTC